MTAKQVPSNPEVVGHLLSRFTFATYSDLQAAAQVLTRCVLSSMQAPATYGLPEDQKLPDEMGPDGAFSTVHPRNIATALISVALAGPRLGGEQLSLDPQLQLWLEGQDWTPFGQLAWAPVAIIVAAPAPAPAPAPVPTAPAPAPVTVVNNPPAANIMALVDAALSGGPAPVQEDPALVAAAPAEPPGPPAPAAAPAPPPGPSAPPASVAVAPATVAATPTVVSAPPAAAAAPAAPPAKPAAVQGELMPRTAPAPGDREMPDPSLILPRTGASGRPQASPFQKKVEARTKLGEPPFWWGFALYAAERILTEHPSQALDPDSQGSGPVQAYALIAHLLHDKVLEGVDPYMTVASLRVYLKEVISNIDALPSAAAINQISDALLNEAVTTE